MHSIPRDKQRHAQPPTHPGPCGLSIFRCICPHFSPAAHLAEIQDDEGGTRGRDPSQHGVTKAVGQDDEAAPCHKQGDVDHLQGRLVD